MRENASSVLWGPEQRFLNSGGLVVGDRALVFGCRRVADFLRVCTMTGAPLDALADPTSYQPYDYFQGWVDDPLAASVVTEELGSVTVSLARDGYLATTLDLLDGHVYVSLSEDLLSREFSRRLDVFPTALPESGAVRSAVAQHSGLRDDPNGLHVSYATDQPGAADCISPPSGSSASSGGTSSDVVCAALFSAGLGAPASDGSVGLEFRARGLARLVGVARHARDDHDDLRAAGGGPMGGGELSFLGVLFPDFTLRNGFAGFIELEHDSETSRINSGPMPSGDGKILWRALIRLPGRVRSRHARQAALSRLRARALHSSTGASASYTGSLNGE